MLKAERKSRSMVQVCWSLDRSMVRGMSLLSYEVHLRGEVFGESLTSDSRLVSLVRLCLLKLFALVSSKVIRLSTFGVGSVHRWNSKSFPMKTTTRKLKRKTGSVSLEIVSVQGFCSCFVCRWRRSRSRWDWHHLKFHRAEKSHSSESVVIEGECSMVVDWSAEGN